MAGLVERGLLPHTAVAAQPHVSGDAAVTTFMVELPGDRRHRHVVLGTSLVRRRAAPVGPAAPSSTSLAVTAL